MAIDWQVSSLLQQPTVNPNQALGVAIQANKAISDTIFNRREDEREQEKLAFDLAAPEREKKKLEESRIREAQKAKALFDIRNAADWTGVHGKLTDPKFQEQLKLFPEYATADAAGRAAIERQVMQQNPALMSSPEEYARAMEASLTGTELFTPTEVRTHLEESLASRFPTMDADSFNSVLNFLKPNSKGASLSLFGGSGLGGAGSELLTSQLPMKDIHAFLQGEGEALNIDSNGTRNFFTAITDYFGIGGYSVNANIMRNVANRIAIDNKVSPEYAIAAIGFTMQRDGDSKVDLENPSPDTMKKLGTAAKELQLIGTRRQSKDGGIFDANGNVSASTLRPGGILSDLMARRSPHAATDETILRAFAGQTGNDYDKIFAPKPAASGNASGQNDPNVKLPPSAQEKGEQLFGQEGVFSNIEIKAPSPIFSSLPEDPFNPGFDQGVVTNQDTIDTVNAQLKSLADFERISPANAALVNTRRGQVYQWIDPTPVSRNRIMSWIMNKENGKYLPEFQKALDPRTRPEEAKKIIDALVNKAKK